jgi:hypothetical protein
MLALAYKVEELNGEFRKKVGLPRRRRKLSLGKLAKSGRSDFAHLFLLVQLCPRVGVFDRHAVALSFFLLPIKLDGLLSCGKKS